MKNSTNKIISDSTFLLVSDILIKLKGIIFFPLIIAKVGLENYGIVVQALINPGIIAGICSLSLGSNFLRFTSKYDEKQYDKISLDFFTILFFSFILSVFGCIFLFIVSDSISTFILSGNSVDLIKLSSVIVVNEVMWRNLGFFLKCRKKFKLFSILILLYQLLPYLGLVIGIALYADIYLGFQALVFIQLIFNFLLLIFILSKLRFVRPSFNRFIMFFKFSWALSLSNISGGLLAKSDRYFIGYFMGPSAIGIYNVVYMVLSFIDQISVPFRNYYGTYLPKIWDELDRNETLKQLRIGIFMYLSAAIFLLVMAVIYMKDFLLLISDLDFTIFRFYYLTIISIGLGIIFLGLNRFYFQIIQLMKQNQYWLALQLIGLTLNIFLNILLLPKLGLLGAGIATLIGYLVVILINNHYYKIPTKPKFTFLQILSLIISVLLTLSSFFFKKSGNIIEFSFSAILSTLIFFVTLIILLNKFQINEIKFLK